MTLPQESTVQPLVGGRTLFRVEYPVQLVLAQAAQGPPEGPGWVAEWKIDGHRTALWRTEETVILQARSGRTVTSAWMDLAVAGMKLPPGTVLDGEACVYVDGRIDFAAAQARAASSRTRAANLAGQHPASYVAFDLLAHPEHGDVRGRTWEQRRALLVDLVEPLGPPIQVVPVTEDRATAALWFDALAPTGVEGLVWKRKTSTYRGGQRIWRKQRHADTVDCDVIGYTGPRARPRHLALRLPDGTVVLSQTLTSLLASQVGALLATAIPARRARTAGGTPYTAVEDGPVVEVQAGSTRHAVATVTRIRNDI